MLTAPSPRGPAPTGRDQRLDMFRGLALVMIFINHVPGTVYENFTNRNFGFSDAAEAFVFMSGMAAGLAYSSRFISGSIWLATAKVWARARQLYFVHLTITMLSLAIFAGAALWFDLPQVLARNNIPILFQKPLSGLIGLPLLTHQLGYLNILPLYITLLLATPLFLIIGLRRPMLLLIGSILLWMAAGQFRLNLPNFPTRGGWFFDPFSWQILFVVGLLCGSAMKQGRTFVPYNRVLFWAAAAFTAFILAWVKVDALASVGRDALSWLQRHGVPFYFTAFDKTYLTLPRLSHALVLFYFMASLGFVRTFADSKYAEPLKLMGRQGLPIFASGTVLSMLGQAIKTPRHADPLFDGLMFAIGLGLMVALAWALDRTGKLKSAKPVVTP
ncbi:OpgC domain-containing protein [Devosia sp.]|uniref:OpgC family protein n=1 Tax=Devosia sp. TaxID=1871048 RepID=UPI003263348B